MSLTKIFDLSSLTKYVNVWAQPFSCQELMPDPFNYHLRHNGFRLFFKI